MHLARMESRIAIGRPVERFSKLRLESDSVEWGASLFRAPGTLPVALA
jgi:cytochrome P450